MHFVFMFLIAVGAAGFSQSPLSDTGLYEGKPSWCDTRSAFGATQSDKETCGW